MIISLCFVCVRVTTMSPVKADEGIQIPFVEGSHGPKEPRVKLGAH